MKTTYVALTALALFLTAGAVAISSEEKKPEPAGAQKKPDEASIWMKKKLEFSQNILAGLTRADFEAVEMNAKAMNVLGFLEKWVRANRPDYQRELKYFETANKALIRQAEQKNLEGATLAHMLVTASCVRCHQVIRDVK
jgi:hypothetical protein